MGNDSEKKLKTSAAENEEEKMLPFVFYRPSSKKGKIILLLAIISILLGSWPIIVLVNVPTLVLGIPMILFWSLVIMVFGLIVLGLARRWGVY